MSWAKKYVNPRISKNDASAAGIFYGEFGLAILTGNTTLKTLSQPTDTHKVIEGTYQWPWKGDPHEESLHP